MSMDLDILVGLACVGLLLLFMIMAVLMISSLRIKDLLYEIKDKL